VRIRLKRGKQQELIKKAKTSFTWKQLANKINTGYQYLAHELNNERRLVSEEVYKKLCAITKENFDGHILEKLEDNWGKSKGGKNSPGNTKTFLEPRESKELAELFGIILGDGHLEMPGKNNKNRSYAVKIAGHLEEDKNYLSNYVSNIIQKLFREKPSIKKAEKYNTLFLVIHGKKLIEFLNEKGLHSGNKKHNNQGIPDWIKRNKEYVASCIRGLVDTDGSIHQISKKNKNLRISYTSYIPNLLKDTRESFIRIGYNPSKIIVNKQIFLSKKEEIAKYAKEIKFMNEKHLKRLENFNH
jgi:hypothetical protein